MAADSNESRAISRQISGRLAPSRKKKAWTILDRRFIFVAQPDYLRYSSWNCNQEYLLSRFVGGICNWFVLHFTIHNPQATSHSQGKASERRFKFRLRHHRREHDRCRSDWLGLGLGTKLLEVQQEKRWLANQSSEPKAAKSHFNQVKPFFY